jgi:hypothetical protein
MLRFADKTNHGAISAQRSCFVGRPFGTVTTQGWVVHLITSVLRKLDIQAILTQTQYINAVPAERFRHFHPKIGGPAPTDITHQDGDRNGLPVDRSPDATFTDFPDYDADASDVDRHHARIRVA